MSYPFDYPSLSSLSFTSFIKANDSPYASHINEATGLRERMRGQLKAARKSTVVDFPKLLQAIEDYLPSVLGLVWAIEEQEIELSSNLEFTWRCILTYDVRPPMMQSFKSMKKPKVTCHSIYYELSYTLLAYGFVLSNWATCIFQKEVQLNQDEAKLNMAAELLCKASGVFNYVSENICPKWDSGEKPIDCTREVTTALARITLADAQSIAIRRALQRKSSHSLLAKLTIGVANNYEFSMGLISSLPRHVVCSIFKKYIGDGIIYHQAIAKRYLAMDAYENQKVGIAVGFIKEAKESLGNLSKHAKSDAVALHAERELEEVKELYSLYKRINDTVSYEPVPSKAELTTLIPGGRSVLDAKPFSLPKHTFNAADAGESSGEYPLSRAYY
ncbi:hypothetical protein K493DRAFT_310626 [Basidiobolus meristosporus CBS 931.73]|uniref:pH-response regulator protein palC n=1 Tax=Basidiobolus meristosporus CBS 931.73 TaxID=1314790 RepID=A0A1Y1Z853_9FUNG|nr:hypothetical protein K493DRAFT_310626 [Basidiobolus meristosporus CBS 931.73]|eukprot:ORY06294.1 hypothetical protein K493DRAFT_310626 [Basidiobolus meristosporus CBS 931.73]